MRIRLFAACDTARAPASDIWPASSTKSTSTLSAMSSRGPEPGRAGGDAVEAFREAGDEILVALGFDDCPLGLGCVVGNLLNATQGHALLDRRRDRLVEQLADHLVAERRDADFLALTHQVDDHPRRPAYVLPAPGGP